MDTIQILTFISGIVVGWLWHSRMILRRMLMDPDTMIRLLEKYKKDRSTATETVTRTMRVERHGEHIYLYAEDNNEFLAQGTTLQAALDIVQKRFPDQNFKGLLSKEEAQTLGVTAK